VQEEKNQGLQTQHIIFPSLSQSAGDQGQLRAAKGNQGQKTGKKSNGKIINLKQSQMYQHNEVQDSSATLTIQSLDIMRKS